MQRIIYLDPDAGYKSLDVDTKRNLQEHQDMLLENDYHIICVLDSNNVVSNKCDCFAAHAEFVNACYLSPW